MKRKLLMSFAVAITALTFSGMAMAQNSIVTVKSQHDFTQTVSNIKTAASQNGMMVMAHLDQGHVLSMTGLHVNGQSFFVGNPNVGKKLFDADPAVGLFLPPRIFVYQGKDGQTYVSYEKPSAEAAQMNNQKVSMGATMIDMKLDKIAHAAAN